MLKEHKLTRVSEDPEVMAAHKALQESRITLDVCGCKVKRYGDIMIPHNAATTTKSFSTEQILEAKAHWETANRDLALAEMDVKSCEGKVKGATKEAVKARGPALRKVMRSALSKFYSELAKAVEANSEVYAARRLACEILGDSQSEIPNLAWPELLAPMYQGKNDECLLDFRRRQVLKSGWL